MATTTATKTVSYKSPFTGRTFQHLTELLVGRDGYISGAECEDDGTEITLQAFTFVQRGIIAEALGADITIPAELTESGALIEPAFIIASVVDDNPASGVVVTVTGSLESASTATIVAFKTGGAWQTPVPVHMLGAFELAREPGLETGGATALTAAGGYITDIDLERGQIIDADGVRRTLTKTTASTAQAFNLAPTRPDASWPRTDHVVRRKVDDTVSEIVHLQGPLRGGDSAVGLQTGGSVIRCHYYGKRGGSYNEQWYAWAAGGPPSNLRIQGGPAGGGFAASTLLVGNGTITHVQLVGQRSTDDAVILVYIDNGTELRMVSFDPGTGAIVDAAVDLNIDAGVKSYLRVARAADDSFHVVYRRQEGGNGEIYYARYSFAAASFGTAAVSDRYVLGAAEGQISLWPDVAVDRLGRPHICWVTGATGTDGSMRYVVLETDGDLLEDNYGDPATGVGVTSDDVLTDPDAGATGFTAEVFDGFSATNITITPHDEVYIAMLGEATADSPLIEHLLLYSPSFEASTGFPILSVANADGMLSSALLTTAGPLRSCDIVAGELGHLEIGVIGVSGANTRHMLFTLNTQPFRNGRFERRDLLLAESPLTIADTGGFDDLRIERDCAGGVVMCSRSGSGGAITSRFMRRGGLRPDILIADTVVHALQLELHPRDVPLLQWEVGPDGDITTETDGGAPLEADGVFELSHVRPRRMNYPFLVGDRGDFQGYNSIRRALDHAARMGGGKVVVRSGSHRIAAEITDYLTVGGGVSLVGEDNALLHFTSNVGIISSGGNRIISSHVLTGNVLEVDGPGELVLGNGYIPRVGDVVDLGDGGSGFHVLRAILPRNGDTWRYLLDDNAAGAPALGAATYFYAAGTCIENLTLRADLSDATHFHLQPAGLYMPTIRNIRIEGSMVAGATGAAVYINACHKPIVENIDLRGLDCDPGLYAFRIAGNGENSREAYGMYRGIRLADGKGVVRILSSADRPTFQDSGGDGSDDTQITWDIEAGRTTPIYMVNCVGRAQGDTDFLFTGVAKTLRVPEDVGALAFEDDNTRGAGITDDAIKLSAAAPNDKFLGADDDVITSAVNARVLKVGDTMSGPLEFRSQTYYATLGLQTLVDRAGLFAHLGEYFFDDFHTDPLTPGGTLWTPGTVGAGSHTWTSPSRVRHSGTAGGTADMRTSLNVVGPWTNKPIYRARAAFNNCDDGNNVGRIGLDSNSGAGYAAFFIQSNAIAADSQVYFVITNDSDVEVLEATAFTPVDGTMYWWWIVWKSATEAYWAISNDLTSAPLFSGDTAVSAGVFRTGSLLPFSMAVHGGGAEGDCYVEVDAVEIATTTRSA